MLVKLGGVREHISPAKLWLDHRAALCSSAGLPALTDHQHVAQLAFEET